MSATPVKTLRDARLAATATFDLVHKMSRRGEKDDMKGAAEDEEMGLVSGSRTSPPPLSCCFTCLLLLFPAAIAIGVTASLLALFAPHQRTLFAPADDVSPSLAPASLHLLSGIPPPPSPPPPRPHPSPPSPPPPDTLPTLDEIVVHSAAALNRYSNVIKATHASSPIEHALPDLYPPTGEKCTYTNGCCTRHPKVPSCRRKTATNKPSTGASKPKQLNPWLNNRGLTPNKAGAADPRWTAHFDAIAAKHAPKPAHVEQKPTTPPSTRSRPAPKPLPPASKTNLPWWQRWRTRPTGLPWHHGGAT